MVWGRGVKNWARKTFLRMIEIENVANQSCSPNLIFRKENRFLED